MKKKIYARGIRNSGGIVDLAYCYDLNGAVVENFKVGNSDENTEDIKVFITLKCKDGKEVEINLVQEK